MCARGPEWVVVPFPMVLGGPRHELDRNEADGGVRTP
jgi:hypothetical protein